MAVDLIFRTPQIKQLEWKGCRMLRELFRVFADNYQLSKPQPLLPFDTHQCVLRAEGEAAKLRLICDYVAGMTDRFAARTYRRFFDPDFGSIGDL
jgi:dGTPase